MLTLSQVLFLGLIQGLAELLPVSSSAHVITAERWMGLDPSSPEMTFLLVMLHTGTMFAVLLTFWSRWKMLDFEFLKYTVLATVVTGVLGLSLKILIEKGILEGILGHAHGEVEHLFKSTPLMALALTCGGALMIFTGLRTTRTKSLATAETSSVGSEIGTRSAVLIGVMQALCLPFRGFSRSGATISTGMLVGVKHRLAEDFSFALAIWLTPPVIALELFRLLKAHQQGALEGMDLSQALSWGAAGMVCSFFSGLLALKWLSSWIESSRWQYFGFYCLGAAVTISLF